MAKEYLTTFEAAKMMSVTPDAVLKWIKSGILEARRTPGGHHRIAKKSLNNLLNKSQKNHPCEEKQRLFTYCWEFTDLQNNCPGDCEDCLVYKISAKGCYKISHFPRNYGHLKLNRESSCEKCNYYKYIHNDN
jgi:excisionase family DNA binding protein